MWRIGVFSFLALAISAEGLHWQFPPFASTQCPEHVSHTGKGICRDEATSAIVDEQCCASDEMCRNSMGVLTKWYGRQRRAFLEECSIPSTELRALLAGDLGGVSAATVCAEQCQSAIRARASLPPTLTSHGAYMWFSMQCKGRLNGLDGQFLRMLEHEVKVVSSFLKVTQGTSCSLA